MSPTASLQQLVCAAIAQALEAADTLSSGGPWRAREIRLSFAFAESGGKAPTSRAITVASLAGARRLLAADDRPVLARRSEIARRAHGTTSRLSVHLNLATPQPGERRLG